MRRIWLSLPLCILFGSVSAHADQVAIKKWSFGVTYAGAGVAYRFSPHWATELRAQAVQDIFVTGVRETFFLRPRWGIYPYAGVEADYATFEGVATEGSGYVAEAFLGGEYYFGAAWSALLDLGPAFVTLEDDNSNESIDRTELVINLGVNYHFGKAVTQ